MSAAVDHCMDLAVLTAGNDDRRLAEECRFVIARFGQFVLEREILPGRTEEDAVALSAVNLRVGKHPVRHSCIAFLRPFERLQPLRHADLLQAGGDPGPTARPKARLYHETGGNR